ncbi:unnamed protein product [Microthlaspi erraticum]|uniref:F-box domain-containing protein n=1 Tax=Microthlaspi erraticum TaxID=1685480 RepID=A0A6D2I8J9_9BRAS|nr:unnamed protein product [Microthlaspi erraticum]
MELKDDVPESVMVMILARLPIRSISRFKSVCSKWKQLFESSYFRNLYRSLNKRNFSSPWSYLSSRSKGRVIEYFGERWGLTKSLGTSLSRLLDHMKEGTRVVDITEGLVLLAEEGKDKRDSFLIGNPVLQQWIKIPSPPLVEARLSGAALVTHTSSDDDLLSYKVVRFERESCMKQSHHFQVFSSETGNWTYQSLICHDFYPKTSQEAHKLTRAIELPTYNNNDRTTSEKSCAVSCGSLVFLSDNAKQLRVWRLKNHRTDPSWEILWNVTTYDRDLFGSIRCTMPMMMHPFDIEVTYLVGYRYDQAGKCHNYLISGNLRTDKFQLHEEFKRYDEYDFLQFSLNKKEGRTDGKSSRKTGLCQFVLPQRLGSIPCPPGCSLVTASAITV